MARLTITLILIALISLISCVQGVSTFAITVDHVTDTSIVWNLTAAPQTGISSIIIYLDGIPSTATAGNNTDIVSLGHITQSGLQAGEWHSLTVNLSSSGTIYQAYSSQQTTSTGDTAIWKIFYTYVWVVIAIIFIGLGLVLARIFYGGAFVASLIGTVSILTVQPVQTLDYEHISFVIYIAFILISLVFWAVNPSTGD
jgi:hypothetical protein